MKRLLVVLGAGLALMIGCGGDSAAPSPAAPPTAPSPSPSIPALQSVTLSIIGAPTLTFVGATAQVIAKGTYVTGETRTITPLCVDWSSDNSSIVSVDTTGFVTARSTGTATISTSCESVPGRLQLRVDSLSPTPDPPDPNIPTSDNPA